jgi:hypothetical protein
MGDGFSLIALDVDGTLLDAAGAVTAEVWSALRRVERRGCRVVLCTGRRFRRAVDAARHAGLSGPIVCNSGALVKDIETQATLWRADFDRRDLAEALAVFRAHGRTAVAYSDRRLSEPDFRVAAYPIGEPAFDEYVGWNRAHAEIDTLWEHAAIAGTTEAFHVCAIGTRGEMLDVERDVHERAPGRVRTFVQRSPRYLGWMCEVMPARAGKWAAVREVAARWGVAPERICAIGDDVNDAPMIAAAGLGVAMSHAPDVVRALAHRVLDSTREPALAEFLLELSA